MLSELLNTSKYATREYFTQLLGLQEKGELTLQWLFQYLQPMVEKSHVYSLEIFRDPKSGQALVEYQAQNPKTGVQTAQQQIVPLEQIEGMDTWVSEQLEANKAQRMRRYYANIIANPN